MPLDDDFIELDGLNLVRDVADRWQDFPCRVRPVVIVPGDEFTD